MKRLIHSTAPWHLERYSNLYFINHGNPDECICILDRILVGEDIAQTNAIIASKSPDMYDCLWKLNKYFIDLQNRGVLTVAEEGQWKQISKILSDIETLKDSTDG
jgi:hypothetical protein